MIIIIILKKKLDSFNRNTLSCYKLISFLIEILYTIVKMNQIQFSKTKLLDRYSLNE